MNIESTMFTRWTKWSRQFLQSRILQIHQKDIFCFEFSLQTDQQIKYLTLSLQPTPLLYILSKKMENENETAGRFCMTLRKYLSGARLTDINQIHADKIVCMTFSRIEDNGKIVTRRLYYECIASLPNLILTQNNTIIDLLTSRDFSHRTLRPQELYRLPLHSEKMNWSDFDNNELNTILFNPTTYPVQQHLFQLFNGLSQPLINELSAATQIDLNNVTWKTLSSALQTRILHQFSLWRNELYSFDTVYLYHTGNKTWCSPLSLNKTVKAISSYTTANDLFFHIGTMPESTNSYKQTVLRKKVEQRYKHAKRKYQKILNEKEETTKRKRTKEYGDLLAIYSYLPISYKSAITVDNLLLPNTPPITIPIIPGKSMSHNSQRYYHQYARLKRRAKIIDERLDSVQRECDYLSSLGYFLREPLTPTELSDIMHEFNSQYPEKHQKPQSRKTSSDITYINYDGFRIGIGKNNTQNDQLTMKVAGPQDMWFHAKGVPGSHVILFASAGNHFTDKAITYAAQLAAGHSRAKTDYKVAVDYTAKKNVQKPRNSPPGFVRYINYRTLTVTPCKITLEKNADF